MAGSTKSSMMTMHERLTQLLIKVLDGYITKLDEQAEKDAKGSTGPVSMDLDLEDEFMQEVERRFEPSPAMLGVITKFLKDNEIKYLEEAAQNVDSIRDKLAEMKNRKVVRLADLNVANG